MPRRKFLTGLFGLVAAPAVVKASNLMPIKVLEYGQWQYTEVGVGFSITREEIGGGLWGSQMAGVNRGLLESFQRTKEIYMRNTLQNMFGEWDD
jgi:hypothetical protein